MASTTGTTRRAGSEPQTAVEPSGNGAATPEIRFRPDDRTADDRIAPLGAAVGSLGLTWLAFERLLPLSGVLGFWLCWYACFVLLYAMIVGATQGRLAVTDRIAGVLFRTAGTVLVGAMALVVGYTALRGYKALRPNFFTQTLSTTGPLDPLSSGGALHAMVGTLEQVGLAVLFSVPLGIATAVYLNEVGGKLARPVRMVVDAMSALPSIVAGLFIFATVILTLGFNKSGLAASLALTVMMMPIITRASEVVLRLVPNGLREASAALGSTRWRTVRDVVLPTARSGLVTAVVLGIARGVGETAPVLLTAGATAEMNVNPLSGPQVSLPLYVFTLVRYPEQTMITRAYGAALVLLILVCALFVVARILGNRGPQTRRRRFGRRRRGLSR